MFGPVHSTDAVLIQFGTIRHTSVLSLSAALTASRWLWERRLCSGDITRPTGTRYAAKLPVCSNINVAIRVAAQLHAGRPTWRKTEGEREESKVSHTVCRTRQHCFYLHFSTFFSIWEQSDFCVKFVSFRQDNFSLFFFLFPRVYAGIMKANLIHFKTFSDLFHTF